MVEKLFQHDLSWLVTSSKHKA